MFQLVNSGSIANSDNADTIRVAFHKINNNFISISSGSVPITGSSVSSSYALTASYALSGVGGGTVLTTGSTYPITSSWSNNSVTASYALNGVGGGTTLITGSTYPITSSWSNNSVTASYALNGTGGGTSLTTGSTYPITSSWSNNALTASYALNGSGGGTVLTTGSTYPITSSWSINSISSNSISSSFSSTASNLSPVAQDLIPNTSSTYSLGSPTNKWKDLYVSSGSIYIGDVVLTTSGSNIFANSQPIVTFNTASGQLQVSGSNISLSSSYALTASYAINGNTIPANSSSYSFSSSFASTSSFAQNTVPKTVIYRYGTTSVVNPGSYVYTIMKYDTAVTDSTSWYDNTTGKFTPTVAGWYQVSAGARVYSSGGEGYLSLLKNGIEIANNGSVGCVNGFLSLLVYFNGSSDYIQISSRTANAITNYQNSTNAPFTMVYITS